MPNEEVIYGMGDGSIILILSAISWAVAQSLKVVFGRIVNKEWNLKDLWMGGGMPSSHSAFVCACSSGTGMVCGFTSALFALSAVMAFVVMYDAANVRWETGKQAKLLNFMQEHWDGAELPLEKKLKESLGHTPAQVVAGGILGVLVSYVGCLLMA